MTCPAVAAISARPDAPVTLLAGDNGTGKSTLIEAFAEAPASRRRAASSNAPASFRPSPRAGRSAARSSRCSTAGQPAHRLLPARRELLQRRRVRRQRGDVLARPLALRRRAAARAVARPVVPRARDPPLRRRRPLHPRRAGGRALGHRRRSRCWPSIVRAAARRRAVHHRDALADPARVPGRADLRARRGRASPSAPTTISTPSASRAASWTRPERYLRAALGRLSNDAGEPPRPPRAAPRRAR